MYCNWLSQCQPLAEVIVPDGSFYSTIPIVIHFSFEVYLNTVIRGNFVFPGQLRSPEWTFRKKTKLLTAFHTDYRTFHQVHHFEDKSFNFKISWNSTFSDKNCGRYDIKREDFFLKKKLKKKHDFSTSINKPSTAQTT